MRTWKKKPGGWVVSSGSFKELLFFLHTMCGGLCGHNWYNYKIINVWLMIMCLASLAFIQSFLSSFFWSTFHVVKIDHTKFNERRHDTLARSGVFKPQRLDTMFTWHICWRFETFFIAGVVHSGHPWFAMDHQNQWFSVRYSSCTPP